MLIIQFILKKTLKVKIMNNNKKKIGKYVLNLNKRLGSGAFSEVYSGVNSTNNEEVAIKVISKQNVENDQYANSAIYSEIQIMKRLQSSNIIKFLDVHETKNNFYIVLEKADDSLRINLKNTGALSEKNSLKCLIQILNGFGQLVKNGIIHRDLKPENILLKGQTLKICDFGFAKLVNSCKSAKTFVGTPAYMSPQILNYQKYNYKCDIWSIGVIAYELCFGRLPWVFKQKNMTAIKDQVINTQIKFPENTISTSMQNFILGCLQKDQNKRFDWIQMFNHQIFGEKFIQNFKKQGSTKISFILSNFRVSLHSKNINLNRILQSLGNKINKKEFTLLIRSIYKDISQQDLQIFIHYIIHSDDFIYIQELVQLLKKHQFKLSGVNLEKSIDEQEQSEKQSQLLNCSYNLINNLKNKIDKQNLDIYKLCKENYIFEKKLLSRVQFYAFLSLFDKNLTESQKERYFTIFSGSNDTIESLNIYHFLCKVVQIVPIQIQ